MRFLHPTGALLPLLFCAATLPVQDPGVLERLDRDPDRGLDAELRLRLGLVDPAADVWPTERWSRLVTEHLGELATLWAEDRIPDGLPALPWIGADLAVPALFPERLTPLVARGGWRIERGVIATEGEGARGFAAALAAWRAAFDRGARLELEVFEVEPEAAGVTARVRLSASGSAGDERVQHEAEWTCTWRAAAEGELVLVAVRPDSFAAAALAGHPAGLFEDVTAAVLGDEPTLREQLAPGLEHWRRRIPASLEPGALGHHGVAVGDVDGDGLEDVYLCQPGGLPNRLLLHGPGDGVRDVSSAAGVDFLDYSSSALLAELDGDGDLDLVVSTADALVFLANDGEGRFERKVVVERPLATSLAAADHDGDGDLDVYACSYLSPYERQSLPLPYHEAENGQPNALLRNDGGWAFVDATEAVGLDERNARFSFAAAWEDYDDDGDQDLYVANDFGRNNLYRSDDGRFRDVAPELSAEDVSAGMGVAWGDADGDGRMDLYVTNMYTPAASRLTARGGFRPSGATERHYRDHAMGSSLLLNRGDAGFTDASEESGTARGRWGWGGIFLELDGDGRLDLFGPNGFVTGEREEDLDSFFWRRVVLQSPDAADGDAAEYALGWRAINRLVRQGRSWNGRERNVAFLGLGDGRFADVSSVAGLDHPDDARAAARVDWDGDGDEDLIVTNRSGPMVRFLSNAGSGGDGWIALRLLGTRCNRGAIGARVTVETTDGRRLVRSLRCGEGYLAQSTSRIHVGLGGARVERLEVRWPGGEREDFGAPEPGRAYVLEEGSGRAVPLAARAGRRALAAGALAPPPPGGPTRIVPAWPVPLPRLLLETREGETAALFGIAAGGPRGTGRPLVLAVWESGSPACRRELEALARAAGELSAAGAQILALGADAGEDRSRAVALLAEIGWPFSVAFATEEALHVLEVLQGTLQDGARSLALPSFFLVDADGRLVAAYEGELDPARLVRDLGLAGLDPAARRDAAVPFPGRWVAPVPEPDPEPLAQRLAASGLERAAAECRLARVEVRELSPATFQLELGLARQKQGRLDEAIRHFESARELDPASFEAARSLAVALHQMGEHDRALEAYRAALALDAEDPLTRFNLGALHLALDDVEGAERELGVLRSLDAELAGELERRIRRR